MNKSLYLVRHAKSSWSDPSLDDMDRPLNRRGRRNAPDMAERLAVQDHRPELIVSSPARRALDTAGHMARAGGIDEADIVISEALYFTGVRGMLDVIAALPEAVDSAMLVGHNPAMTGLLDHLCGAGIGNMPTCAIAIVGFDASDWRRVPEGGGRLLGYDTPKGAGHF